jgi:2-amino-4-hydroxy-6-hydroxymethyldihydropteridine diphosphokinase
MNRAVLSLGSNLGNRLQNLQQAKQVLEKNRCTILQQSSIYETEAWGNKRQDLFYNEVMEVETPLSAEQLMNTILRIENLMGRVRKEKWEPRLIDIDILFFNDEIIDKNHLTIPHPHLDQRKFVLVPLNEILPEHFHPILKKTVSQLLQQVDDLLEVKKIGRASV